MDHRKPSISPDILYAQLGSQPRRSPLTFGAILTSPGPTRSYLMPFMLFR